MLAADTGRERTLRLMLPIEIAATVAHTVPPMITINDDPESGYSIASDTVPPRLPFDSIFVIDLVRSGSRLPTHLVYTQVLRPLLTLSGNTHTYIETTSADFIAKFAERFTATNALVVFILGDTSINEFINHLPAKTGAKVTIAPIPAGTGNSLALLFDIDSVEAAINRLFLSRFTQPLYAYQAEYGTASRLFLVVFSWCFHAALVADLDTPELRKHGLIRFRMAAEANLAKPNRYYGNINVDGNVIQGPFAYFVATLSVRFEPTFIISPNGDIRQNSLYVVTFPSGLDIMEIMQQVYDNGAHIDNPNVNYIKVEDTLTLSHQARSADEKRFCIDGEIVYIDDGDVVLSSVGNNAHGWQLYTI